MFFLWIWFAVSLALGICWALAGWLFGRRREDRRIAAEAVEAAAEEEAA